MLESSLVNSETHSDSDFKAKKKRTNKIEQAIGLRNKAWKDLDEIPKWVDINDVNLDQFFTKPEIAEKCWKSLQTYIRKDNQKLSSYKFVEPSAGEGAFYDLLPDDRRVGIDIVKSRSDFIQHDFLTWEPKKNGYSYACIGNPPFGYRAWLALAFLNQAAKFSDYVGFILPMGFQSRGKGNPQDRVQGLSLVHSELLPMDSFIYPDGKVAKVNALWQIWSKKAALNKPKLKTCNQYIDLFTVDQRKERLCGQKRLHEANYFLQRTFYNEPPALVTNFSEVKYVCGYGIVIKKKKREITKILKKADWKKHSNLASHNCRHISMCHIREAIIEAGYYDD